jgi:uncharacterized protein DUF4123
VRQHLFDDDAQQPYAVLDGASIPDLLDHLYGDERPEFACLYPGEVTPDLAEVAPYLVRLEPDADFTAWVLEEGWGHHWGIFAVARGTTRTVRQHLRRFLIVHDSTGKPLYFRYYDPRVLRVYLPTCNAEELKDFFGPVSTFVLEDEDLAAMTSVRTEAGVLSTRRVSLAGARGLG